MGKSDCKRNIRRLTASALVVSSILSGAAFSEAQSPPDDLESRIKAIVIEHLGVDASKIQNDSSFIDDLGADSLDTVELIMAFEEEFGKEIPDNYAESIKTFGDAVIIIRDCPGLGCPL